MGRTWSGGPGVPERAVRHDGVMRIRRGLAGLGWRLSPYRLVGHEPPSEPGVFLGAPHTGNWDFIALLGVAWHYGMPMKVLIKDSWVRGPAGPLIRAMGGIGVDRSRPGGLVDELVARAGRGDRFQLVIAPKGTRSPRAHWPVGIPQDRPRRRAARHAGGVRPGARGGRDRPHADDDRRRAGRHGRDPRLLRALRRVVPARRSELRLREEDAGRRAPTGPHR